MNGLTLVALLAVAIGFVLAWRIGVASGKRAAQAMPGTPLRPAVVARETVAPPPAAGEPAPAVAVEPVPPRESPAAANGDDRPPESAAAALNLGQERARIVRSLVTENARLRAAIADSAATVAHLEDLAQDRSRLFAALAASRADTARYRALVIDFENNAPPPLLDGPSSPDDLKLIVGIGPVLERLLQQMGIATYRQIARWSERDIDDVDARLPEFPGRIRRDAWVTQARALHQSKYGDALPPRDR